MTDAMLDPALKYAEKGLSVIPLYEIDETSAGGAVCSCGNANCSNPGKHPRIRWKSGPQNYQEQPASEEQIREWWEKWPSANIGLVTGEVSGVVVLDIDGPKGKEVVATNGIESTALARTGGGGGHLYLQHPGFKAGNFAGDLPDVDFRGDGGYVVAPPSRHISGRIYSWQEDRSIFDTALAECPGWLKDRLKDGEPQGAKALQPEDWDEPIPKGERNSKLTRLAGSLIQGQKRPAEAVLTMLAALNQEFCKPPLPNDEVGQIVQSIYSREKKKTDPGEHLTDAGNAKRFIAAAENNLKFWHDRGKWLWWNGRFWEVDETETRALEVAESAFKNIEAEANLAEEDERRKAIMKHARRAESRARIEAMQKLAMPQMAIQNDSLDKDPLLLNVENGTLDLRSGELRGQRRRDFITTMCPAEYHPEAACPEWRKFLDLIFDGDVELIDYIQRAVGYCLTGSNDEKAFFILWGGGDNGKTTFVENIAFLLGDLAKSTPISTLIYKKIDNSIPNDLARLRGVRLAYSSEAGRNHRLNEERIKAVTGGQVLAARFLYKEFFEFEPRMKFWLDTNYRPEIRGTDDAIWSRVHLIPFDVCIPEVTEKKARSEVDAVFEKERAGILAWAVQGCLQWQKKGLQPPDIVKAAGDQYRDENDELKEFFEARCKLKDSFDISKGELYEAYKEWCADCGDLKPLSMKKFSQEMMHRGFEDFRETTGKRRRMWRGLKPIDLYDHNKRPEEEELKEFFGGTW